MENDTYRDYINKILLNTNNRETLISNVSPTYFIDKTHEDYFNRSLLRINTTETININYSNFIFIR